MPVATTLDTKEMQENPEHKNRLIREQNEKLVQKLNAVNNLCRVLAQVFAAVGELANEDD